MPARTHAISCDAGDNPGAVSPSPCGSGGVQGTGGLGMPLFYPGSWKVLVSGDASQESSRLWLAGTRTVEPGGS